MDRPYRIGRAMLFTATLLITAACGGQGPERAEPKGELANSASPYLRMHADNPVDWRVWGQEALDSAQARNELLIVSIGYTACHWCHVMEKESFMDSSVARIMNQDFVPIKVDREQRPAVDERFMKAARLSTGQGGWPLNAIALPDGSPVMAVTYLPRAKWSRLLKRIRERWEQNPESLRTQARKISRGIRSMSRPPELTSETSFTSSFLDSLFEKGWEGKVDPEHGGGKGSPKFPMPVQYHFLMGYAHLEGNERASAIVHQALTGMAQGGIYDHVAGGFHRYSTDAEWKVPHFEKMLYDNGQLIGLYSDAYRWSDKELYARVVEESMRFIEKEMRHEDASFYSSLSAVVDGVEGKYYTWRMERLKELLSDRSLSRFQQVYSITGNGNWKNGRNVLHREHSFRTMAERLGVPIDSLLAWNENWMRTLRKAREGRERPMLDDKRITAWNGMMISGAVKAYRALDKDRYLDLAKECANSFWDKGRSKGGLFVRTLGGEARLGYLDDQVFMVQAFLDLYAASFQEKWLRRAEGLTEKLLEEYAVEGQAFLRYRSRNGDDQRIATDYRLQDGTTPSPNSAMAYQLLRLHAYLHRPEWKDRAQAMLDRIRGTLKEHPVHHANWANAALLRVHPPYQVAIVGEEALQKRERMDEQFLPHAFLLGGRTEGTLELLQNKRVEGPTRIYVCQDRVCERPVRRVDRALEQLLHPIENEEPKNND